MRYLALDGGATHISAGLYDAEGTLLGEATGPPANPVAYGMPATLGALAATAAQLMKGHDGPFTLLAGVSGARNSGYRRDIAEGLCAQLDIVRAVVTTDIHPLLEANAGAGPALLAVSGTGATVLAREEDGTIAQAGGHGSLLGEEGSAYAIAISGMRTAAHALDGVGPETILSDALPRAAGLSCFDDLVGWTAVASKKDIADLSRAVDAAAAEGDKVAQKCIEEQARWLAVQVATLQDWLDLDDWEGGTPVYTHGGVFEACGPFLRYFQVALDDYDFLEIKELAVSSHGALLHLVKMDTLPSWAEEARPGQGERRLPRTEQRAESATPIDGMTPLELVTAMNAEDARAIRAVAQQAERITAVVECAAEAIKRGGRIIYVGAGTSGRLGVLDASECPPTFGVPPERVVGLIAGGELALRNSVEGAEDDTQQAAADIRALAVDGRDIVVGITASGTTPYVLAALEAARLLGADTALVCSNLSNACEAGLVVAMDTGPEILTGSTRLKAGTAAKLVLNMISTGAMALAGYVHDGMMVGMAPVNKKLRERAARMLSDLLPDYEADGAAKLLEAADYNIAVAVIMGRRGVDRPQAEAILEAAGGMLGPALRSLGDADEKPQ